MFYSLIQVETNRRLSQIEQHLIDNNEVSSIRHIKNASKPVPLTTSLSQEHSESSSSIDTIDPFISPRSSSPASTRASSVSSGWQPNHDSETSTTIAFVEREELSAAIKKGDLSELQHLLDTRRDSPDVSSWISSAFLLSCRHKKIRLAKALLSAEPAPDLTIFDSDGQNPLHNALHSFGDSTDILSLLISKGCDLNTPDNTVNRRTPLHHAVIRGKLASATLLISNGASIDSMDGHDITPLEYAVTTTTNTKLVSMLLSHGATFGRRPRPVVKKSIWKKEVDSLLDKEAPKRKLSMAEESTTVSPGSSRLQSFAKRRLSDSCDSPTCSGTYSLRAVKTSVT
jgi:ankyrin repeat protein